MNIERKHNGILIYENVDGYLEHQLYQLYSAADAMYNFANMYNVPMLFDCDRCGWTTGIEYELFPVETNGWGLWCSDCFGKEYEYCNDCDEAFFHTELNSDFLCEGCLSKEVSNV